MIGENDFKVPTTEDLDKKAFYQAASKDDTKTMQRLLQDNKIGNLNMRDQDGRTPLHFAAAFGRILSVKFLLDRGANKDIEDRFGKKPIDYAEKNGYKEIVKLLGGVR